MNDRPEMIAREMLKAHPKGQTYKNLEGELAPSDIAEAYAAQARLIELHASGRTDPARARGKRGGCKIALASKVQQDLCGVDHPIAGAIFNDEIMSSPATVPCSEYHGLGIEFELAVTLSRDLDAQDAPYGTNAILDAVASVHPAFELITDRSADYANLDALTLIADNAWCAGVVLGPAIGHWRGMEIDDLAVRLGWNDEPPVHGVAGLARPVGSLVWVVNLMADMGQALTAGDIVITGSVFQTRRPKAGDRITYRIADQEVVVAFV
jgi:2-keto-4-pentenoate hydratase